MKKKCLMNISGEAIKTTKLILVRAEHQNFVAYGQHENLQEAIKDAEKQLSKIFDQEFEVTII